MGNERNITPQDRVIERGRGCWNCKSFENGALSRQHWATCRASEEQAIIARGGDLVLPRLAVMEDPVVKETNARFEWMDNLIKMGRAGMCMKGKAPGTFVHHKYLCDGWSGKDGASMATSGHAIDKLPEELVADAEAHAKPVKKE
jgi:hypothetical protein